VDAEFVVLEDRSGFNRAMGAGSPPSGARMGRQRRLEALESLGWGAVVLGVGAVCVAAVAVPLAVVGVFLLGLAPL
jgi:hypothetical protein